MTDNKVTLNTPAKGAQQGKYRQTFNGATSKWKASPVPNGISELAGIIFDCEGKGTDFQKNVETIGSYVGQKMEYGCDMNISIMNQKMVDILPLDRPSMDADQFNISEWKVEFGNYFRHRKKIELQLRMVYSIIWAKSPKEWERSSRRRRVFLS